MKFKDDKFGKSNGKTTFGARLIMGFLMIVSMSAVSCKKPVDGSSSGGGSNSGPLTGTGNQDAASGGGTYSATGLIYSSQYGLQILIPDQIYGVGMLMNGSGGTAFYNDRTQIESYFKSLVDYYADYWVQTRSYYNATPNMLGAVRVVVIPDCTFKCNGSPNGLCAGNTDQYSYANVAMYRLNKSETKPENWDSGQLYKQRTSQQMSDLAGGGSRGAYWTQKEGYYWCDLPKSNVSIPALLHEWDHQVPGQDPHGDVYYSHVTSKDMTFKYDPESRTVSKSAQVGPADDSKSDFPKEESGVTHGLSLLNLSMQNDLTTTVAISAYQSAEAAAQKMAEEELSGNLQFTSVMKKAAKISSHQARMNYYAKVVGFDEGTCRGETCSYEEITALEAYDKFMANASRNLHLNPEEALQLYGAILDSFQNIRRSP